MIILFFKQESGKSFYCNDSIVAEVYIAYDLFVIHSLSEQQKVSCHQSIGSKPVSIQRVFHLSKREDIFHQAH
jgi:hypothetical protein